MKVREIVKSCCASKLMILESGTGFAIPFLMFNISVWVANLGWHKGKRLR